MIQPCEIGDAITAGAKGEQNDAGEGTEIHEEISRHIKNHGGKSVFGATYKADHHEAGLTNGAVGQHPFHRCLRQGNNVAKNHAEQGQNSEQEFPLGIKTLKATHQNS